MTEKIILTGLKELEAQREAKKPIIQPIDMTLIDQGHWQTIKNDEQPCGKRPQTTQAPSMTGEPIKPINNFEMFIFPLLFIVLIGLIAFYKSHM